MGFRGHCLSSEGKIFKIYLEQIETLRIYKFTNTVPLIKHVSAIYFINTQDLNTQENNCSSSPDSKKN